MTRKFTLYFRATLSGILSLGLATAAAAIGPGDVAMGAYNGYTFIGEVRVLEAEDGIHHTQHFCEIKTTGSDRKFGTFWYGDLVLSEYTKWEKLGYEMFIVTLNSDYKRIQLCPFK